MAPSLARKVLIYAAVDGLILQPLSQRGQRPVSATKITYKDNDIGPALKHGGEGEEPGKSFEAFGVVGLLTVSKTSFLISIIKREQVAQIQNKPVYVVTEVALTPLASRSEAEGSIINTQATIQRRAAGGHGLDESDTDGDEEELSAAVSDDDVEPPPVESSSASGSHQRTSSVAEDVITRKGSYGRFAQKWFSRKGWAVDQRRNLGMTGSESSTTTPTGNDSTRTEKAAQDPPVSDTDKSNVTSIRDQKVRDVAASLLPKLLTTTSMMLGSSRSFFFSYDFDITRNLMSWKKASSELPLHTQVDPMFFWNRYIIQPFIDAGQNSLVLPLMQGFVGQRSFEMDPDPPKQVIGLGGDVKTSMELVDLSARRGHLETTEDSETSRSSGASKSMKPFLATIISRRSVHRAGLRYLRRGIEEDGFTANTVETEQILSDVAWTPSSKIYSFVQIRGSVPIFFSQSPYSFKPVPHLQHSEEMNYRAFLKHFTRLAEVYGNIQIASLVEKHGNEAIVGEPYEKYLNRYNSEQKGDSPIGFEWFDFHAVCRGMKFERVTILFDNIGKTLDEFGDTVQVDGKVLRKQTGVLRTNCMDCLDRTNVTQSACGRRALESQLKREGIDVSLQTDQTMQWFNTLWADNGDSISKQYASTAAMKGDFTRTRKRDLQGALKDMGISISRFYSGIVNDYFSQAAIDFLLGNVSSVVFEEFEANLMSGDPAVSMPKLRQQAIEMCQKLVVADEQEELVGGWTLLTPQIPNTIRSSPFEESVLLLTDVGLYSCRFDWNLEKVSSFERVDLQHVTSIKYGTYITSTLSAFQADEQRNVGLVVTYSAGADDVTRVNSRSLSNIRTRNEEDVVGGTALVSQPASALEKLIARPAAPMTRVLALKALSTRSAVAVGNDAQMSEIDQVKAICSEIERMILHGQVVEVGTERKSIVERGDIISLAEARKSTGFLDQLGHSLKKLVWA